MAVPRNRMSNARKKAKRSHMAKKPKTIQNCSNCAKPTLPHRVCPSCGSYANKVVVHAKQEKE